MLAAQTLWLLSFRVADDDWRYGAHDPLIVEYCDVQPTQLRLAKQEEMRERFDQFVAQ